MFIEATQWYSLCVHLLPLTSNGNTFHKAEICMDYHFKTNEGELPDLQGSCILIQKNLPTHQSICILSEGCNLSTFHRGKLYLFSLKNVCQTIIKYLVILNCLSKLQKLRMISFLKTLRSDLINTILLIYQHDS